MRPGTPAGRSRLVFVLLFAALVLASLRLVAAAAHHGVLATERAPNLFQAATVAVSAADVGPYRRFLGGTVVVALAHATGTSVLEAAALFHGLAAACVALAIALLVASLDRPVVDRLAFVLVALALMARWGEDPGRLDPAVAGCLAWAAVALRRGRPRTAAGLVALGLAFHETAFVFGLPLLVALRSGAAATGAPWTADRRSSLGAVAILALAFVAYALLPPLGSGDPARVAALVGHRLPDHPNVDWALYFAFAGSRGVATSVCQNLGDPNLALHVGSGLLVIGIALAVLAPGRRHGLLPAAMASVPPFLFLCAVANDTSRWAVLAVLNVWLVAALRPATPAPGRAANLRWIGAALLLPLLHPKTARVDEPIFAPAPVLERIAIALGGPRTPSFESALARCDPGWRDVLRTRARASP